MPHLFVAISNCRATMPYRFATIIELPHCDFVLNYCDFAPLYCIIELLCYDAIPFATIIELPRCDVALNCCDFAPPQWNIAPFYCEPWEIKIPILSQGFTQK